MDALSQVLEDIHLKNTEYLYLQTQGEWTFRSPAQSALICHIVMFGELHIHFDNRQHVHLNTGDMLIIPSGMAHVGKSQSQETLLEAVDIEPLFSGLRDDAIHLGHQRQAQNKTTPSKSNIHNAEDHAPAKSHQRSLIFTIRSKMDSVMASPLIHALPTYLHLKNALNTQEPEWLRIGLYFVAEETKRKQAGRHKIMDHLVSIMLIECIRDYIANLNDPNNWLTALTHPELSAAFNMIHGHPERAWTVESLAECCFMSRSKFAQLFNEIVGETPLAYLQQHRLRLASQMLRNGQLSIQHIAHQVGYNSETAFSQVFKKHYGLSPSLYRQQSQTQLTE
ncbi:AraC family transcriptional regulator [Acinetobacter sp. 187]|uniref:AraC family transcriptional regulator n=1 Tax=Acinetobacter lanii TaxID=2715163 RepID=UPI00140A715D|nr:AraC family transcriptional regulator [Acinetobacter lanii]NHC04058.1 AraC family transcriptional regulator [Acinetobacter lanii]